jgi:hypothetical protein
MAAAPVETIVKPFLHELTGKLEDPAGFKNNKRYGYLIKSFMALFVLIEALAVGDAINIFAEFGIDNISNEAVSIGVALLIPIFTSQIHDTANFVKLWVKSKTTTQPVGDF